MARSESRWKVSIWVEDLDFLALTKDAQRVYFMLVTQPTISLCGVLALTTGRWERSARDETPEELALALKELEDAGFIVIDRDTEELWVRTFILHDGVARSPKTLAAAKEQVGMIASATIREGVNSVFSRLANGGEVIESAKPQENRVSGKTKYPIPILKFRPGIGLARARTRSPSPVSSLHLHARHLRRMIPIASLTRCPAMLAVWCSWSLSRMTSTCCGRATRGRSTEKLRCGRTPRRADVELTRWSSLRQRSTTPELYAGGPRTRSSTARRSSDLMSHGSTT